MSYVGGPWVNWLLLYHPSEDRLFSSGGGLLYHRFIVPKGFTWPFLAVEEFVVAFIGEAKFIGIISSACPCGIFFLFLPKMLKCVDTHQFVIFIFRPAV